MAKVGRILFSVEDWTAGLAGLKLGAAAAGVYIQTISFCYAEGTPSINEERLVARLAAFFGDDPRTIRAAIRRLVEAEKLTRVGAELEPRRVRVELERTARWHQQNRENGAKGGRPSTKTKTSETDMDKQTPRNILTYIDKKEEAISPTPPSVGSTGGLVGAITDPDPVVERVSRKIEGIYGQDGNDPRWFGVPSHVRMLIAEGVLPETIEAVADRYAHKVGQITSLKYLVTAIRSEHAAPKSAQHGSGLPARGDATSPEAMALRRSKLVEGARSVFPGLGRAPDPE